MRILLAIIRAALAAYLLYKQHYFIVDLADLKTRMFAYLTFFLRLVLLLPFFYHSFTQAWKDARGLGTNGKLLIIYSVVVQTLMFIGAAWYVVNYSVKMDESGYGTQLMYVVLLPVITIADIANIFALKRVKKEPSSDLLDDDEILKA